MRARGPPRAPVSARALSLPLSLCVFLLLAHLRTTHAHGFLNDPPCRGSLNIRASPKVYNASAPGDQKVFFPAGERWHGRGGALRTQKRVAGMKWQPFKPMRKDFRWRAGVCGDKLPKRDHLRGGIYYFPRWAHTPELVRTYRPGAVIDATLRIVGHHNGFVEFHLCDVTKCPDAEISPECFRRGHCVQLQRVPNWRCDSGASRACGPIDRRHRGRWYMPCSRHNSDSKWDTYGPGTIKYQIPPWFRSEHAVLHWYWAAGNNCNPDGVLDYYDGPDRPWGWGKCRGQAGAVGGVSRVQPNCGGDNFPEDYYNCADIRVAGKPLKPAPKPRFGRFPKKAPPPGLATPPGPSPRPAPRKPPSQKKKKKKKKKPPQRKLPKRPPQKVLTFKRPPKQRPKPPPKPKPAPRPAKKPYKKPAPKPAPKPKPAIKPKQPFKKPFKKPAPPNPAAKPPKRPQKPLKKTPPPFKKPSSPKPAPRPPQRPQKPFRKPPQPKPKPAPKRPQRPPKPFRKPAPKPSQRPQKPFRKAQPRPPQQPPKKPFKKPPSKPAPKPPQRPAHKPFRKPQPKQPQRPPQKPFRKPPKPAPRPPQKPVKKPQPKPQQRPPWKAPPNAPPKPVRKPSAKPSQRPPRKPFKPARKPPKSRPRPFNPRPKPFNTRPKPPPRPARKPAWKPPQPHRRWGENDVQVQQRLIKIKRGKPRPANGSPILALRAVSRGRGMGALHSGDVVVGTRLPDLTFEAHTTGAVDRVTFRISARDGPTITSTERYRPFRMFAMRPMTKYWAHVVYDKWLMITVTTGGGASRRFQIKFVRK